MKKRQLGFCGLEVSAIGFSSRGLGAGHGATMLSRSQQIAVVRAAYDFGVTFFDAADAGASHYHETLVGEAIAPFRNRVVVATPFGLHTQAGYTGELSSCTAHIRKAAEDSLKRLNVETIDLLYLQQVDPSVPIEEVACAVKELVAQGKVKHFGLGEAAATTIRRAHAAHPVSVLLSAYSLSAPAAERNGVLQTAKELGIGFVASSPLGGGVFACTPGRHDPGFSCGDLSTALPKIAQLAERKYASLAQIALAWLLAQNANIVPLPSTHRIGHLDENLGGADIHLNAEDLQFISAALTHAADQAVAA